MSDLRRLGPKRVVRGVLRRVREKRAALAKPSWRSTEPPAPGSPIPLPPEELQFVGPGDFEQIARTFAGYFVDLAGLQPGDRVLDVGSGIGRIAAALTGYLTTGTYDGIEIVKDGVDWCRQEITSRHPNFRFHHADIHNSKYNPKGKVRAAEYTFPFADDSFDFIYLTSVFTHMLPEDVEHYLDEIARVLRPGGKTLITFNLLNDESKAALAEGRAIKAAYPHDFGVYRVANKDVPEGVVAYEESWVRSQYERVGLELEEPIRYGSWAAREVFLDRQDVLIATRA